MSKCGKNDYPPTLSDALIYAIEYIFAEKYGKTFSNYPINQSVVKESFDYLLNKPIWEGLGGRFWENKKFLESLSENEKHLLTAEIVEYVNKNGVSKGLYQTRTTKNNIEYINLFFSDLKKEEDTSKYFCKNSYIKAIDSLYLKSWEIIDDHLKHRYIVEVKYEIPNEGLVSELLSIDLYHSDLDRCVWEDACIKNIEPYKQSKSY